jgi:hypothetical protein
MVLERLTLAPCSTFSRIEDRDVEYSLLLESVCIPVSVELLGDVSFADCRSLEDVSLESASKLSRMAMLVVAGCHFLSKCTPASVVTIEMLCFSRCNYLESFTFEVPTRIRSLLSTPSSASSSIDISDYVEVLQSSVSVDVSRYFVFCFGSNSHLKSVELSVSPSGRLVPAPREARVFCRLPETKLRSWYWRGAMAVAANGRPFETGDD